jgi:hypothetical protein
MDEPIFGIWMSFGWRNVLIHINIKMLRWQEVGIVWQRLWNVSLDMHCSWAVF